MPIRSIAGLPLKYCLVCIDATGAERANDPDGVDGRMVPRVADMLLEEPYTDVFLMSHGWMGDVPAAIRQYDLWIAAMAACKEDIAKARQMRPRFKPLLVGLHWPSLPYGDEEISGPQGVAFSASSLIGAGTNSAELIAACACRIANTPAARKALHTIFEATAVDAAPPELSREVANAYLALNREAGLGADGPAGGPSADREPFDPDAAYEMALEDIEVSFGSVGLGPVLSILRNLSFFKMKDRAHRLGQTGFRTVMTNLQETAKNSGRDVRFHLMGHSFGCIAMLSALVGLPEDTRADPVHSGFLAQGAMSFWSLCGDIPYASGKPGYFYSVIEKRLVTGALVTTQSRHDTAVCRMYPLAIGVRGDVAFAPGGFPKYGALGAFGARGPGVTAVDLEMLEANEPYDFQPGKVYNVESSRYISNMQSVGSGAHNDIAHPQVAHAMWSAVLL